MRGHTNLHISARFKDLDSAAFAREQLETKGLQRSRIELGSIAGEAVAFAPESLPAALAGAGLGGGAALIILAGILLIGPLPMTDALLVAIALMLGAGVGAGTALLYRRWVFARQRQGQAGNPAVLTVHSASRRDAAVAEFMLRGCENVTHVTRRVDPAD